MIAIASACNYTPEDERHRVINRRRSTRARASLSTLDTHTHHRHLARHTTTPTHRLLASPTIPITLINATIIPLHHHHHHHRRVPHFQSIVLNSNRCTTHDTPPARPSRAPKNPSPHTAPDARAHVVSRVAHRARACPTRVPITHPITRIPSPRARASTTTPPTALSRDGARDLSQSRDTGDHRTIDASKPMTRALDSTRLDSTRARQSRRASTQRSMAPHYARRRTDMVDSRARHPRVVCALVVCARERPVARRESSRAGSLNPILIHTPRRAVGLLC